MSQRLKLFLRSSWPDFVLCLVASAALVYTVSYGFESVPQVRSSMAVCTLLPAVMLVVLFAGAWSKRAVPFAAAGAAAYAAIVVGVGIAAMPAGVPLFADGALNDVAENSVPFCLVACVVPVLVYLLSRRRAGALVLFFVAALTCCVVQFLYRDWVVAQPGTAAAFVALAACGAIVVFQSYRHSVLSAQRAGRASFAGAAGFSVGIAFVCVAVGALLFWAVLDPLALQTPQLKPFQDYYSRPVIEYTGVYTPQTVDDPDELTDQTNDSEKESNQDTDGGDEGQDAEQDEFGGNPLSAFLNAVSSFDVSSWLQQFTVISYQQFVLGALLVVLAIVAAVVAAVLARRHWRAKRLARLAPKSAPYRTWWLYEFLLSRLAKLGISRPSTATPLEFAMAQRAATAAYFKGSGTDLLGLTLAYQRAAFAPETLTEADVAAAQAAYTHFYKNAYTQLGPRRWLVWFWRL